MNTLGSYRCVCFSGFHGDGRSCVDTDECRDEINVCSVHARCENNPGSYRCSCKIGYSGNGMYCTGKLEKKFFFFSICQNGNSVYSDLFRQASFEAILAPISLQFQGDMMPLFRRKALAFFGVFSRQLLGLLSK